MRLHSPARLVTVLDTRSCIVLDLSRNGARIALEKPLDVDEAGYLKLFGEAMFVCAVRADFAENGLEFDDPLSDERVLQVRTYSETMDFYERRKHLREAREWVTGKRS